MLSRHILLEAISKIQIKLRFGQHKHPGSCCQFKQDKHPGDVWARMQGSHCQFERSREHTQKLLFQWLLIIFLISSFLPSHSQEKGTGPKEKSFKQELKSNKQVRREAREKRKLEKAERKAVKKYHKRLQTKKVRKRMKSSKKAATRYNNNKREFFLKRWFKNKKLFRKKS